MKRKLPAFSFACKPNWSGLCDGCSNCSVMLTNIKRVTYFYSQNKRYSNQPMVAKETVTQHMFSDVMISEYLYGLDVTGKGVPLWLSPWGWRHSKMTASWAEVKSLCCMQENLFCGIGMVVFCKEEKVSWRFIWRTSYRWSALHVCKLRALHVIFSVTTIQWPSHWWFCIWSTKPLEITKILIAGDYRVLLPASEFLSSNDHSSHGILVCIENTYIFKTEDVMPICQRTWFLVWRMINELYIQYWNTYLFILSQNLRIISPAACGFKYLDV